MAETYAHALPPRFRIDEYEIVRVLGAGGFGITYLAFDHNLDGPVAIKEYFPADIAVRAAGARLAATGRSDVLAWARSWRWWHRGRVAAGRSDVFAWGLDRFLKEAQAIHRLRHSSLVRVHRYVKRHATAYIVMEYVEGESLASILESRGRLPADEWQPLLDRLLDALAHVHDHGYLHRDIKPANIVIRAADGEPVLIDFGAARVASQQRTHTRVLTDGYAPIEQYTNQERQRPPTDIYALAAVSCHVLTGEPPPNAPDRMLDDWHEPLAQRVDSAGAAWLTAIDNGLELRPEDRPQTVTAWREALRETGSQPLDATELVELREAASQNDPQALAQLRTEAKAGNPEAQFVLGEVYEHMDSDAVNWYDEAVEWYRKAADQGHAGAQFRLGDVYQYGAFGSAADAPAMLWYYRAAAQGHVGAQFELGNIYREGVPSCENVAVEWYRKAAVEGHVLGLWRLVAMFASACGDRIPQDNDEAVGWLRKAADRGHVEARFTLGQMYSHGKVVPRDLVIAHMWFTLAEDAAPATLIFPDNGPYERAQAAKLEIEPDMTSAEMDEADRRARVYPGASPEK